MDNYLSDQYDVISLDFQDLTDGVYRNESTFVKGLAQVICDTKDSMDIPVPDEEYNSLLALSEEKSSLFINDIFRIFDRWCRKSTKPVVLIIDEIDTAANNKIFLDFLGKLRSNYMKREINPRYRTFHSVILAGVTDIKHMKSRIRPDEEEKENSPWNISADFNIDMSLSETGIKEMLDEELLKLLDVQCYDPMAIVRKTHGIQNEDYCWLKFGDDDRTVYEDVKFRD